MSSCVSKRKRADSEDVLDILQEFNKGYEHEEKDVEMDKPRKCSYNNKTAFERNGKLIVKKTMTIGEPVPRQKSPNGSAEITPMPITPLTTMGSCPSLVRATNEDVLDIFHEFIKGYKHEEKDVEMDKPRECSYNKKAYYEYDYNRKNFIVKETITVGEPICREKLPNGSVDITTMPIEFRGITLRQLRAIIINVKRRCAEEGWKDYNGNRLTPETVTLHDINTYIIKLYTEASKSSFVETLPSTDGTQPPRFFVSHTWGETFFHTMDCIEQMFKDFKTNYTDSHDKRGGGMTEDTPIWICAFANNQHDLENAITADPSESGFAKAMDVANYRTLSILDEKGEVFTRIWCILELDLTLIKVQEKKEKGDDDVDLEWNGLWAVYTVHEHIYCEGEEDEENRKAVGIVAGGAPCDSEVAFYTAHRERPFPRDPF